MLKKILLLPLVLTISLSSLVWGDQQLYLNNSMTNGPYCDGIGPASTLHAQWENSLGQPSCTLKSSYGGTFCGIDDTLHPYVGRSNQIKGCHCVTWYEAMGSVIVSACGGTVKTATFYVSYHECIQDNG